MNEATKLWAMHVPGPDDVFAMESEAAAHEAAEAHNKAVKDAGLAERFGLPEASLTARVIEWPHSAESHTECLANGEPEVLDTTNGCGIPDSLFNALQARRGTDNAA